MSEAGRPRMEMLDVRPVTPELWADLEELFEQRGPRGGRSVPSHCWCAVWRERMQQPADNRAMLERCVQDGPPPGLLAYEDGSPVGWVSVAPRPAFARLARSRTFKGVDPDPSVHVISCFYVPWDRQGEGISSLLLDAAVAHAKDAGATAIEGSPADPPDFTGTVDQFLARGFEPLRTVGNRTVMHRAL